MCTTLNYLFDKVAITFFKKQMCFAAGGNSINKM